MEGQLKDLDSIKRSIFRGQTKDDVRALDRDPYEEELEGILGLVDWKHYKNIASILGKKSQKRKARRRSSALRLSPPSSEGSLSGTEDDEDHKKAGEEKKQGKLITRLQVNAWSKLMF